MNRPKCQIRGCDNEVTRDVNVFETKIAVCPYHAKQYMGAYSRYADYKKKKHIYGAKKWKKEIIQKFLGGKT